MQYIYNLPKTAWHANKKAAMLIIIILTLGKYNPKGV